MPSYWVFRFHDYRSFYSGVIYGGSAAMLTLFLLTISGTSICLSYIYLCEAPFPGVSHGSVIFEKCEISLLKKEEVAVSFELGVFLE